MNTIMKQRHDNIAVRSEVLTAMLLWIQVIWTYTILSGRYGSYSGFEGKQRVHTARNYLPHKTVLTSQEASIFMMELVLNWWHTLKFYMPLLPSHDTPTILRSDILTALLLKIQVFSDVTLNYWASSSWKAKGSQLGTSLFFLDCLTLKMKVLCSFKMSLTHHSKTQHLVSKTLTHHFNTY